MVVIVFLIKVTGLYFAHLNKNTSKCIWFLTLMRVILLCVGLFFVLVRNLYRSINNFIYTAEKWNVETTMLHGWLFQSLLSMFFFIHWQKNGSLSLIRSKILGKGRQKNEMYKRLTRDSRVFMFITLATTVFFAGNTLSTIILSHFSHRQYLNDALNSNDRARNVPDFLMKSFSRHNEIAEKIQMADDIFKVYTFLMTVMGTTQSIMALLILIRRETWLGVYYSVIEMAICVVHLIGLTVVPAEVYTEFHEAQTVLYRKTPMWKNYDIKTYQIARSFTEKLARLHVGISFGGFTVITKSLILTCISLIVPYVLLCVQMQVGSDDTLRFYIFRNHTMRNNMLASTIAIDSEE
ncbi:CBR-GUR-4 protein [Ditylenchus destructor]|uniref:CBR-GUR-4 protein n=1 Tax=Ditylenchus destructor TaxID=166010 RepID=A0AAD4MUV8_9BILA|nr:CBR-GUR-4 protein [Ditylenchus destructor]